ncbi:hypothetical protein CIG2463D_1728 [Campylobacter iguaniorum]|uniref:Uncharacterized protein n=1 Tax=Campylobacter iguaniorum TaxID=1244531 RepID=A0A076FHU2_9BACT|nr:hypothetical protein [Campylobacter iguaniorum]AII15354.1 hypothetical protein CIG1485E_1531 [Campylobacter iguaniorum]ALV25284.1 hypothetical protein CIG2463D_1728 [Campylobacter iguaniorum]
MTVIGSEFVPFRNAKITKFSLQAMQNQSEFVLVNSKKEAVLANANEIKFIVCNNLNLARQIQSLANDYIFDSKIALIIANDDELEDAIEARIDAVIYQKAVIGA